MNSFLDVIKTTLFVVSNNNYYGNREVGFLDFLFLPFGGAIPRFSNLSLCVIGKTMASTSYERKP